MSPRCRPAFIPRLAFQSACPITARVCRQASTNIHYFSVSCDLELGRCGAWNPVSGSQTSYGQRAARLQET